MSVKAMSAAFETGDSLNLPAIDRLLLLRLGDWADDYGYCWPGIDDLVAKVGVDERTIRRHLSAMEAGRLVIRLYGKGGRHRSSLYRILPDVLPDNAQAPGKLRYIDRFKVQLKEDTESAFLEDDWIGQTGKGDRPRQKGGHSSVPRSVMIHQNPSEDDFSIPKQEPDEPLPAYLARIHSLLQNNP